MPNTNIKGFLFYVLIIMTSLKSFGQVEIGEHNEHAHLTFQCAVCSNHLGYAEPRGTVKGGFVLNVHKNSLVEVDGLYQCEACKTPIFKSKNLIEPSEKGSSLYFSRPINNESLNIAPYNVDNLGLLKDHCPVCANKFANSKAEVHMGNFGANITFRDLKGIFRKP